jgi:hypothetical protein
MKRHTEIKDILGLTIQSVHPAVAKNHYEAFVIRFTDGSEIVLLGGGYEGYGDFIRVEDEGFEYELNKP